MKSISDNYFLFIIFSKDDPGFKVKVQEFLLLLLITILISIYDH